MKIKISSTQIIIGIIAFLVGVGTASYIMHRDDNNGKTKNKPLAEVMESVSKK